MGNPRIGLGRLLRRWWLVLFLATILGALVAYAFGSRVSATFEANAEVLIGRPAGLSPTYAELVKSTPVLAYALRATNQDLSIAELRDNVRGESDAGTRIVTIEVDAGRGREAIALANAVAAGLRRYASTQPAPSAGAGQASDPRVALVDPARSAVRIRPRPTLLLEFGAFAGLFAGLAFVLVAEARTPRVNGENDLVEVGGLPVLGSLDRTSRAGPLFQAPAVRAGELASYRRLVARVALASGSGAPRSLLVVGADGAHGSRRVAVDLGLSLALDGLRVAVVDFEGDGIKRSLQSHGRKGGASFLRRLEAVACAGITLDRFTLRSGPALVLALPRARPRGLSVDDAETIVTELAAEADVVIVHGPPPTRSRSALTWARAARATLLVVAAGRTTRSDVEDAVDALEPAGGKLLGAVLVRAATSQRPAGEPHETDRTPPRSGGPTTAGSRAL